MKKILATCLTIALTASLVACGAGNGTSENVSSETFTTEETITTESNASTEETIVTEGDVSTEEAAGETLGPTLLAIFKDALAANPEMTAEELADTVVTNEVILFAGATAPVEEGFLSGFREDITGFEEGVMFAPIIGSIPFMGYVFTLAEDADTEAFLTMLEEKANMRWNVCTEAEEMVMEAVGNKVFFVMCPKSLED